MNNLCAWAVGW